MEDNCVKLSTNWLIRAGCKLNNAVQIQEADPDIFVKPNMEDLIIDEKAVLLCRPEASTDKCDLIIQLFPHYKIQAFNLICNVRKVEIFQGPLREYFKTVYGQVAEESSPEDDDADQLVCYRYDVEIDKSGITEIAITLITHMVEICLFGIRIHVAPNPNGITTLINPLGPVTVNVENVQNMLKHTKDDNPSVAQTKCLEFFNSFIKSKANTGILVKDEENIAQTPRMGDKFLTTYIDGRFKEMQEFVEKRLSDMEQRQNAILERILTEIQNARSRSS